MKITFLTSSCWYRTSGSSPLFAVVAVGVCQGGGFGSSRVGMGSSLSLSGCLPFSASSSGSALPLAPPLAHFATPVAQTLFSVAQLSSPAFLSASSVASSFPPVSSFSSVFPSCPPPGASFSSSAPSLASHGFPFVPPVCPLAPPVGLRPPVSSLVPAVVP